MQKPVKVTSSNEATWHAQPADVVVSQLDSSPRGLSNQEAARRLTVHGRNELPPPKRRSPLVRFLAQFHSALIYFLLTAAVLAALIDHWVDASVILLVALVNALVGFIQEGRAEQALAALRAMLSPSARVRREGQARSIPVAELVPGDIVELEAGDRVPADLRLIRTRGLLIDESILTGESVAAEKRADVAPEDAALGDRHSMAWSGTFVAAGRGYGVVTATGLRTQIGHISSLLEGVDTLTTPLLRQINRFGRRFTAFAIIAAALLFFFALQFRQYDLLDAFMLVVALAVGVVPESLPAVITITLALGVRRMAARNAIVRRLPAVETLGATSIICSDKTGTLTRNEMAARRIITADQDYAVMGEGYAPEGYLVTPEGQPVEPSGGARMLLLAGLLCNDSRVRKVDERWVADGDPMEAALLALAARAGLHRSTMLERCPRLDEIPFDAEYRYMAALHKNPEGGALLLVKGAPERVLAMCTAQVTDQGKQPIDPNFWEAEIAHAGAAGERVLGFAWQILDDAPEELEHEHLQNLNFAGIVGFIDPPRAEAIDAVADCLAAGIQVKMITGDHAATAVAIAKQLGLSDNPRVVTGADLDALSDEELVNVAYEAHVFARTSPEHKLRVVRALQSRNAIVAMTGDGVNDTPSLKQADVGIAMGRKGTEAAKEAAEVVLADDNFASIDAAVYEGRTVYDNIRKVIAWTIPTNGGEALAIIFALLLGITLPMTPVQILWINLILTVTLGLSLAFEPPEPGVMRRPPRKPNESLLTPFMKWRIAFVSLLFVIGTLSIFGWTLSRGHDLETARTMVVNTMCVFEIFYLFSVRFLRVPSFSFKAMKGTPAVWLAVSLVVVAQLAFTYVPWMNDIFQSRPVPLFEGAVVIGAGVLLWLILEVEKAILRRMGWFTELSRPTSDLPDLDVRQMVSS